MNNGQFARFKYFAAASCVGAAIDFLLILYLTESVGLPGWQAIGLSMLVSASVVYVIHEFVTFRDPAKSNLNRARWTKFVIWSLAVYGIRVGVYGLLMRLAVVHMVAVAVAILSTAILNFVVSDTFIFGKGDKLDANHRYRRSRL